MSRLYQSVILTVNGNKYRFTGPAIPDEDLTIVGGITKALTLQDMCITEPQELGEGLEWGSASGD